MKLSTTFRCISIAVLCLSLLVTVGVAGGKHIPKEQQESSQTILSLSKHAGTGLPANVSVAEIKKQIQEHRSQIHQQKPMVNERNGRRTGGERETSSRGGEQRSPMSDISNFLIMRNVDMVSGGYGGMRNSGVGTIVTQTYTGTVLKAFLYWNGPTNSSLADANSEVQFNGTTIFGDNIGFSDDNCWGFENSQAYRADVTDIVSAIAGPYTLSGFLKQDGDININGVSLIVFYDDGDSANNRDFVVFDGNDSNYDNVYDVNGWNVMLNGINYTSGNASMILHVSDGQIWVDDNLYLNSVSITDTNQVFEGKSVPYDTVSADNTNGSMWDIKEFDISSSLVPGSNDIYLYTGLNDDCLALVTAIVSLPAGSAPSEFGTGKISGAKFLDANNNGLWDEGENGIEGWEIVLSGAEAETTETDPYGNFTFRNLLPGSYTVSEINRDRWTQTAPESSYSVTLDSGSVVEKLYFGNYPLPSSVSGYKWEDVNGNYEWDVDESGIMGWVIYHDYYDLSGYHSDSTVTDSSGYYSFANLTNGGHYFYEQSRIGWQQTYPFSYYYYFEIDEPGEEYTNLNFGNIQVTPVTISGMKFNDMNNNGVKDEGEPGLANWVIHLYPSDMAMKLMEKSPLAEGKKLETMPERIPYFKTTLGGGWTATTDSLGMYSFTDIYPGYYYVVEEPQAGWQQTYPAESSWQIQVVSGINRENIDFGNYEVPPPPPFVCGDVYAAVSNGQVYRFSQNGTLIQVLNTGLGGYTAGMAFDTSGNIYVTNFSANSVSKFDTNGTNLGTFGSGYNGNPESILFDKLGNAFVGQAGSSIIKKFDAMGNSLADYTVEIEDRGTDWIDLGGDQTTMFYTSEGNLVKRFDVGANTQLQDFGTLPESPAYALRLLPGGGALVAATGQIYRLDNLGNVVQSYDAEGQNQWFALNLDPDGRSFWSGDFETSEIYKFDIETGNVLTHFNTGTNTYTLFGLTVYCEVTAAPLFGSISGTKFNDMNGNGMRDENEPGIPEWAIVIEGPVTARALTDINGEYHFTSLPLGEYLVCEMPQEGWVQTYPDVDEGCYEIELTDSISSRWYIDFGNHSTTGGLTFDKECITFPTVRPGETLVLPLTLTNESASAIGVSFATTDDAFNVVNNGSSVINPGESLTVDIDFSPANPGEYLASLFVMAGENTDTLFLAGQGELEQTGTGQQIFAGLATMHNMIAPKHSVVVALTTSYQLIKASLVQLSPDSVLEGMNYALSIVEGQAGVEAGDTILFGISYGCDLQFERICSATIFQPGFPPEGGYTWHDIIGVDFKSVNISLREGYNAVSWNVLPHDQSIMGVFGNALYSHNVKIILDYVNDGSAQPRFDFYIPALGEYNPLQTTDFRKGYFVNMWDDVEDMQVWGQPVCASIPLTLFPGYNFVSYLPEQPYHVTSALSSLGENLNVALDWVNDDGYQYFDFYPEGGFEYMHEGKGYFLNVFTPSYFVYPDFEDSVGFAGKRKEGSSATLRKTLSSSGMPEAVFAYGKNVQLNGTLIPKGTEVKALDNDGVVCGTAKFLADGIFALPILADNPSTAQDEGASKDELVKVYIGNQLVSQRVKWTKFGDTPELSGNLEVLAAGDANTVPQQFVLHQNYPNPFNPTTSIKYELPNAASVSLKIYDMLGQEVRTLIDAQQDVGFFEVTWDGTNNFGQSVSSGIYTYRLTANDGKDNFVQSYKMILMK